MQEATSPDLPPAFSTKIFPWALGPLGFKDGGSLKRIENSIPNLILPYYSINVKQIHPLVVNMPKFVMIVQLETPLRTNEARLNPIKHN